MVQIGLSNLEGEPHREISISINPAYENANRLIWLTDRAAVNLTVTVEDIEELNKDFELAVQALADKIDEDNLTLEKLPQTILEDLARTGRSALTTVFGINGLDLLDQLIRRAQQHKDIPIMIIKSEVCYLPWEVFFWDDADKFQIEGSSVEDKVASVLNRFWALNFIIARTDVVNFNSHTSSLQSVIESVPSMKVKVIFDGNIDYAKDEANYLENLISNLPQFIYDPFIYQTNLKAEVNDFLHNQADVEKYILHIACHAIAHLQSANRSYLRINGYDFEIRDLTQRQELIGALFVFLNACSTGVRVPTQTLQFVQSLRRRKGVPNVLATEFVIETYIAQEFAKIFYDHFLQGNNLGESIYYARHQALAKATSNVGIITILFYSLYGDPYFYIN